MEKYQPLLFVLVALIMAWFGGGVVWNIRRGNALLKWMQGGLPALGERTTLRWLGSSAVQMEIAKALPPFRRCQVVVVMEPRDVPWLWLLSRRRGRRDMLILRGQLVTAPRLEYDIVAPESWTGRSALASAEQAQWGKEAMGDLYFLAPKASLPVSREAAVGLLERARQVHPQVWWLSVRREYPQLELHIPFPDARVEDPRRFFQAVRSLAQQAA